MRVRACAPMPTHTECIRKWYTWTGMPPDRNEMSNTTAPLPLQPPLLCAALVPSGPKYRMVGSLVANPAASPPLWRGLYRVVPECKQGLRHSQGRST